MNASGVTAGVDMGARAQPTSARAQPPAAPAAPVWHATGLERPVFADPTGRRARRVSLAGIAIALATLLALAIVVTGTLGVGRLAVPPSPVATVAAPPALRVAGHRHPVLLARIHPDEDRARPHAPGRRVSDPDRARHPTD